MSRQLSADSKRGVVLLSGGLDSATTLAIARASGFACYCLSIDYGQRHRAELQAAAAVARALMAREHRVLRLQLDEMDADYEQSVFEELGQNFLSNLAARGMTLDTWLPASGLTMEQFIGDLHKQANDVARESLALDALARELKIEVTEDDINAEFEKAGVKDVEASKAEFIADGRMPAVRESIRRSKAVDHLVENAKVTEVDETAKDAE